MKLSEKSVHIDWKQAAIRLFSISGGSILGALKGSVFLGVLFSTFAGWLIGVAVLSIGLLTAYICTGVKGVVRELGWSLIFMALFAAGLTLGVMTGVVSAAEFFWIGIGCISGGFIGDAIHSLWLKKSAVMS